MSIRIPSRTAAIGGASLCMLTFRYTCPANPNSPSSLYIKIAITIAIEKTIVTFLALIFNFLIAGIINSVNAERWNNDPKSTNMQ